MKTRCHCCGKFGASVLCKLCNSPYHYPCSIAEGGFLEIDDMTMICAGCCDKLDSAHYSGCDSGNGKSDTGKSENSRKSNHKNSDKISKFEPTRKQREAYDMSKCDNQALMNTLAGFPNGDKNSRCSAYNILKTYAEKRHLKNQLYCTTCGQNYDADDLDIIPSKYNRAGWQCPVCKVCQGCRKSTDEHSMIMCDRCDRGFHTYCMEPVLHEIPSEEIDWFCPDCEKDEVCVAGRVVDGGIDLPMVVYSKELVDSYRVVLQNVAKTAENG